MHKKLLTIVLAACFFSFPGFSYAGVPEAVTYLASQPAEDWSIMALRAAGKTGLDASALQTFSGTSATDYAKRILAIIAAGENPRTFTGSNLVAGLQALATAGQLGDPNLLNDDAWGILALRAAGVPAEDLAVTSAADFLVANQEQDGGWGWAIGAGSDTNDTAAVLMALNEVGYTAARPEIVSALAYLASQQRTSGGFAYQTPCPWPGCDTADADSTAWVYMALTKFDQSESQWQVGGKTPKTFLESLQHVDGSYHWQPGVPSFIPVSTTSNAVIALSGKSFPVVKQESGGGGGTRVAQADLVLSVNPAVLSAAVGGEVSLEVTVTNSGPDTAQAPDVVNLLFEGSEYLGAVQSGGVFDAAGGVWHTGVLYPGRQTTATFKLRLTTTGTKRYTFTVSNQGDEVNPNDNQASIDISVREWLAEMVSDAHPEPQVLGEQSECLPPARASGVILDIYCLDFNEPVKRYLSRVALGITNTDLAKIPLGGEGNQGQIPLDEFDGVLLRRLEGMVLLQVEEHGEAWYVHAGKRYYLPPTIEAVQAVRQLVAAD